MADTNYSSHSRLVTLLLCWFFGVFGAHRFYTGKIFTGILMLLTGGGLLVWWIIDLIVILVGSFYDKGGKRVYLWFEPDSI